MRSLRAARPSARRRWHCALCQQLPCAETRAMLRPCREPVGMVGSESRQTSQGATERVSACALAVHHSEVSGVQTGTSWQAELRLAAAAAHDSSHRLLSCSAETHDSQGCSRQQQQQQRRGCCKAQALGNSKMPACPLCSCQSSVLTPQPARRQRHPGSGRQPDKGGLGTAQALGSSKVLSAAANRQLCTQAAASRLCRTAG